MPFKRKQARKKNSAGVNFYPGDYELTLSRRGAVVKRVEHISKSLNVNIWTGVGWNPVGSVNRNLNSQKLLYFNGYLVLLCVSSSPSCKSELIGSARVVIVPGEKNA